MRYWALHSNPKIWNSKKELIYETNGIYKINLIHKGLIKLGDKGILWISGTNAGVYSLIEIVSNPYKQNFHYVHLNKYALNKVKFIGNPLVINVSFCKKLLNSPFTRQKLLENNVLNEVYSFINPQGQNTFELSERQYKEVLKSLSLKED